MPRFSSTSLNRLETCDIRLQRLFKEVVKIYDCSIICGHRNAQDQNEAYEEKKSQLKYPESKHNGYPSKAVDVCPYPIAWNDLGSFYMFAGYVQRVAEEMGIKVRYGGDWDGDKNTADQTFNDLPHWELVD